MPTATPGEPACRAPALHRALLPFLGRLVLLTHGCPLPRAFLTAHFLLPSGLRDILLLPLQLPRAIRQAATHKELEAISHLGMGKGSRATHCTDGQAEAKREREGEGTQPEAWAFPPAGSPS